jgi:cyclophilin family peptidyl-prolyl cis-trans isomerase
MPHRLHPPDSDKHTIKTKKKSNKSFNDFLTNNFRLVALAVFVLIIGALIWIVWVPEIQPEATLPTAAAPAATEPTAAETQPAASLPTKAPTRLAARQYDKEPPMSIDPAKKYTAAIKMAKGGEFTIQLYPDKALRTVNSFVFLAREGYFDGVTFHRVLEGFMAQGGDPTGTGGGGPGYQFINEDSDLTFDKPGVVAMANAGRDTNGSQFFITFTPTPQLNGGYTIFGQVISGMEVVNAITRRDPNENPAFTGDVIESITIIEE